MTTVIEGIVRNISTNDDQIVIALEPLAASDATQSMLVLTCNRAQYQPIFEQQRLHVNTFIVVKVDSLNGTLTPLWLSVPTTTEHIRMLVQQHRSGKADAIKTLKFQQKFEKRDLQAKPHEQEQHHNDEHIRQTAQQEDQSVIPSFAPRMKQNSEPDADTVQIRTRDILLKTLNQRAQALTEKHTKKKESA